MKLNSKQLAYFFILVFIPEPIYALICIDSTGYLTFNTYFVPDSVSCSNGEHFCETHYELINEQVFFTLSCSIDCKTNGDEEINGVRRFCCSTDNCNRVELSPRVSSCYSGGTLIKDYVQTEIEIEKRVCATPQNQFCAVITGIDELTGSRFTLYQCMSMCVSGTTGIAGINKSTVKCCAQNDCNTAVMETKGYDEVLTNWAAVYLRPSCHLILVFIHVWCLFVFI